MNSTFAGIVMDEMFVPPNAALSILVKLSGRVTDVIPAAPLKAIFPIVVTESGIVIDEIAV